MLIHDAALSFLHFAFVLVMAGALSAELFVLRLPVTAPVARLLLRIDLFNGISAVGLIVAGVSRVVWGAKGWEYYSGQPFFWVKMVVFGLIGLISIAPTRAFFKWVRLARADANFVAPDNEAKLMRRAIMVEVHLLTLVILFAALMARGLGS